MKLLKTTNIEIIKYCREQFDFKPPRELIDNQTEKFYSQIAGFLTVYTTVVERLIRKV